MAQASQSFWSINPADGSQNSEIAVTSKEEIDQIVQSARDAFQTWSKTSPLHRAQILRRAASLIRERNDAFAKVETLDTGRPFSETSTVDVPSGVDVLEFMASFVASGGLNGETAQLSETSWMYTKKEPLGVGVGIGAWNYPIQIALWKSAPCLAAGNTMVYKPSEFTPLHAKALEDLYLEAGLPKGVFTVVQGAGDVGAHLNAHPGINKVSFTGQVSTGQKVASTAAYGMKGVTMELGGKSPCIILPDAAIDNAVNGAMMANFFSTGQVCTNGTRVFVHESQLQRFEDALLEKMQHIRPGDPLDPQVNFGPLVSKVHFEKVIEYIRHGIEVDKARLLYGGKPVVGGEMEMEGKLKEGFWVQPTVFVDCTDDMKIVKEEIFGPVMTVLCYRTIEEVIERANAISTGLAAGVFTNNVNDAHQIISRLEAGITWINTWGDSPAEMSVGGWKLSGVGVENGRAGIDAWVQNRSTFVNLSGKMESVFSKL